MCPAAPPLDTWNAPAHSLHGQIWKSIRHWDVSRLSVHSSNREGRFELELARWRRRWPRSWPSSSSPDAPNPQGASQWPSQTCDVPQRRWSATAREMTVFQRRRWSSLGPHRRNGCSPPAGPMIKRDVVYFPYGSIKTRAGRAVKRRSGWKQIKPSGNRGANTLLLTIKNLKTGLPCVQTSTCVHHSVLTGAECCILGETAKGIKEWLKSKLEEKQA